MWIARNQDGTLFSFRNRPWKNECEGFWIDSIIYIDWQDPACYYKQLKDDLYPELRWTDDCPLEVLETEITVSMWHEIEFRADDKQKQKDEAEKARHERLMSFGCLYMVGDYVNMPDRRNGHVLTQIRDLQWKGLYHLAHNTCGEPFRTDEVEPVELTDGLVGSLSDLFNCEAYRDIFDVYLERTDKEISIWQFELTGKSGCKFDEVIVRVRFLHEIQQIMRAVGMADLADNIVRYVHQHPKKA